MRVRPEGVGDEAAEDPGADDVALPSAMRGAGVWFAAANGTAMVGLRRVGGEKVTAGVRRLLPVGPSRPVLGRWQMVVFVITSIASSGSSKSAACPASTNASANANAGAGAGRCD